jgi:hypothetical protein
MLKVHFYFQKTSRNDLPFDFENDPVPVPDMKELTLGSIESELRFITMKRPKNVPMSLRRNECKKRLSYFLTAILKYASEVSYIFSFALVLLVFCGGCAYYLYFLLTKVKHFIKSNYFTGAPELLGEFAVQCNFKPRDCRRCPFCSASG